MWNAAFVPRSVHALLGKLIRIDATRTVFHLNEDVKYEGTWCPLSRTVADGWSRILIFTALGYVKNNPVVLIIRRRTIADILGAVSVTH